jgi:nicotinate-nucleotide--dimethylbenzimidazole phosphoribosyltransferase
LLDGGAKCLLTGDMGIANTTPAAALIAVFTDSAASVVTGRGTGIDDATHARKVAVVEAGLKRHRPERSDPLGTLAAVGGLEHAALTGFILGAAERRVPVIIDGVIAASAALAAQAFAPDAVAAMVAGHRSAEPGASVALDHLSLTPLLDLGMRLGEGTGAVLALPIVAGAVRVLHEVATFDSAGVSEK